MPDIITAFDAQVMLWVQENLRSPLLSAIMIPLTTLGNSGILFITLGIILLLCKRTRKSGILMLICLAVGFILNDIVIKNLVQRPRPFTDFGQIVPLITLPGSYSFPSGHTVSAFAAMITLFFTQKKYTVWGLLLAVLMGFSRIYVGVHYPTDVLAGAVVGTAVACILGYIFKRKFKDLYYEKK